VRWEGLTRLLRAAANDDGSAAWHDRLTPDAWQVIRLAAIEARELGHPCIAEEHVLLGLLRHRASRAAALLEARGLDLPTARADLHRVGPTLGSGADPAGALRTLGIDVEEVRGRLEATFGAHAVRSAEWRVRRRPRWRGGHPRPSPLCVHLLAKRSLELAARFATRRDDAGIGPDHLLYGVLDAARDPLGTRLGRRSRRELASLGFTPGRPNPLRLQLEARGIDLTRLATELSASP
jgi:ATP-dependent Clp protease ATP-binding subunit ClpA